MTINFLRNKKLTCWLFVREQWLSLWEGTCSYTCTCACTCVSMYFELYCTLYLSKTHTCIFFHTCTLYRGMFTLALSQPLPTAPLAIPPLNLSGRVPPRNASVGLDHMEKPAGMTVWAEFHNGAAAGLKISPHLSQVTMIKNFCACTHTHVHVNTCKTDNKLLIIKFANLPILK